MLENIRGHSRGSIPPLRMPSPLPHDLCHEWNVSRRLPAEMYRNTESLCMYQELNSVVGQLYFKNTQASNVIEKEIQFVVTRGGGLRRGGIR